MVQNTYKARAPGSIMLMGEHAVLDHNPALVAAVDKYIKVEIIPMAGSDLIIIDSDFGGYLEISLTKLNAINFKNYPKLKFILASMFKFYPLLRMGCKIIIKSEFSAYIGFGSSAAVTVALVAALRC